jgi:hypothetical protein
MLLAVGCGVAILVAGAVLLLRVANQDTATVNELGVPVSVGDMTVTVDKAEERPGLVLVDIEIGGVEDDRGSDGFSLVTPDVLRPDATAGNHCAATTVQVQPCTLAFRVAADAGSSRVLLYQRGDERVRWDLAAN